MNRIPNPASLPNNDNNSEHEQRIAAIREKAQRHAQRSARLFAPPPEPEGSDLPVPTLLAVACSVALANQAQAQATTAGNETQLRTALSNATTIELSQDISLTSGSESPIFGHNGLNIDGKNHTVELNKNRALWNAGITRNIGNISKITFRNGAHFTGNGSNGGVIDLHGTGRITGNITNSHFENSHAANVGGAIFANAIDGSIKDSAFTGNSAGNSNASGSGGAIHIIDNIKGDIEKTRFENNTAAQRGGAIYAKNINGTIRNSQFINNKSTNSHGGALYIVEDIKGGIEGSTFTDNTAKLNGGAIDIATLTGGIRNSQFINNYSETGTGGAVFVHSGVLNGISGSTFKDNRTWGEIRGGGAISVNGAIEKGIQDSTFENNKVLIQTNSSGLYRGAGGAILAGALNGGITDSTFKKNTALTGGAIFLSNGSVGILNGGIDNSKFIGNTATLNGGGAIHLHGGTLNGGIKNGSEFRENTAKGPGGAIWTLHINDGINDSKFIGNKSLEMHGGAISSEIAISGDITNTIFKENSAYTSAGALYTNTFSGNIDGSTFEKNSALNSGGGAIHISATFSGDIKNGSKFINNTAKSHGGALWGADFKGSIIGSEFSNNTAEDGAGGAIWIRNSITGNIQGSIFQNNKAEGNGNDRGDGSPGGGNGGAIRVSNIDGAIDNSTFTNNTANYGGGAIHLYAGTLGGGIKNGSKFIDNTAGGPGGAIWANTINNGISDSEFIGNKSLSGTGGAIRVEHKITGGITDSIFRKNRAGSTTAHGGGAIATGGTVASGIEGGITGSTFEENEAKGVGGAIGAYVYEGGIHDSQFINNKSGLRGGALDSSTWINGGITSGSLFSGNTADSHGGAIYTVKGISGGISDTEFKNNTSTNGHGGAIATDGSIIGDINNVTFDNNKTAATATGGAIAVTGTGSIDGSIINSTFSNNSSGDGGALRTYYLTGDIDNTKFIGNTAYNPSMGGGAIHSNQIYGGIKNGSVFENNVTHGQHGGGAIFTNTINDGISDSTFAENKALAGKGGAIHAQVSLSGGITGSEFKNNSAAESGGGIFANTITGNISGGTFADNTANLSGGAIYTTSNITGGITNGALFENNTATTEHGGAILTNSITGDITGTFSGNQAKVHGGALYLNIGSNSSTVRDSVFSGNQAGDLGGAIFHKEWGYLNIENSQFLGNIAHASGGAIKTQGETSIKESAFIGNQATGNTNQLSTPPASTLLASGVGGALLIQGKLDIENSVFLGNTSATRGAAIHHHHDGSGGPQNIRIAGNDAGKTLFYGNQETGTGRYSSIEFAHHRNHPSVVTIEANKGAGYVEGNSGVLMLDAMQSVNRPGANEQLTINKTGDGDWFLGGDNQMKHPGNWVIDQGRLALTDVDYDGSGAQQAQINLTEGGFTLNNGAILEGRGTISASEINLNGTINPNIWRNTGMLAKDITTGITQADIDGIQTVADKADSFATLTLDTQGSGNAVKMDGATYEVGVAWKDNGSGGFDAQSDLLDVKGALEVVNNSGINITRLDFDETWALARIQGGGTEPAATVIQTTQGITGDFNVQVAGAVAPSSDFLKVRGEQTGNNYEIKLGLSWYSTERDSSKTAVSGNSVMDAHGGFTVDAGNSFTIGGALGKRTDVPNFSDETSEQGGAKGWDGNSLTKRGDGTLILNADNTYDGLTTIEAGKLVLGDSAAKASARVGGDVQINNGAIFDGYGRAKGNVTVDNGGQFTGFGGADGLLHVKNGGLLAPGSATDMATVEAGRLQIDAGGTYQVKTNASGATDLVNVTHDATLHGGTVEVRAKDGNWGKRGTQHAPRTIIQTGGTLTGTFDDVTTDLAFLTPTLDYNSNQVNLGLTRNSTKMEDVADGSTYNKINTADALSYLEASGANPTLMNELLGLNKDDALRAFNSLSGEIYPTTGAVLLQSSRQLRTRINTRLTSNTQGTHEAPSFNAIRALGTGDTGTSTPVWVSAWGHNGNQGRSSNVARADISGSGVLVGMDNTDRPGAGGLHAGVMFGSESTKVQIADDRNSRSEVESRSAGLYGGSNIGDTQWRGGLIYSDLDVETQRTVTVNSLTERVSAERKGKQMQAFAEISHNLTLSNRTSVAPWLNVAKVWQSLDATHEGTGATALEIDKQSTSATLTSIGGRGLVNLGDGRTPVSLYADVGYQYVIDGRKVDSKHHFAGQPQDFAVRGTTLNDTLIGAVGVQLGVSRNSALLVEYRGEFGSGQQQHVGNISYQVKF